MASAWPEAAWVGADVTVHATDGFTTCPVMALMMSPPTTNKIAKPTIKNLVRVRFMCRTSLNFSASCLMLRVTFDD